MIHSDGMLRDIRNGDKYLIKIFFVVAVVSLKKYRIPSERSLVNLYSGNTFTKLSGHTIAHLINRVLQQAKGLAFL